MIRIIRGILPVQQSALKPKVIENVPKELLKLRELQNSNADPNPKRKVVPSFTEGERIRMRTGHREWKSGIVLAKSKHPRSYIVRSDEGSVLRRNVYHLHKSAEESNAARVVVPDIPSSSEASEVPSESPPSPSMTVTDHNQSTESRTEAPQATGCNPTEEVTVPTVTRPVAVPTVTRSGRTSVPVDRYQGGWDKK